MLRSLISIGLLAFPAINSAADAVDYTKDVKPILATHCVYCHGADESESGLRVDAGQLILDGGDRGPAIVPGKSTESLLYQVLVGEGEEDVTAMPLDADPLSKKEIAIIKKWIDDGADFPDDEEIARNEHAASHWAFQPVKRPTVPTVEQGDWCRTPIDRFVLHRLEESNQKPSPPADRRTLIRRLSFDLRGLPPSWEEVEKFLADRSPNAYENLVDRMLASPQYGERWGRHWLDVARYADSHGFTIDGGRQIWLYRDWVIDAFNADKPFDEFTIAQLAGDLLPNATIEDQIATGFHRNTLINQEGGTDAEQFRIEAVADRVDTTGAAWMGLTLGCARCHQHKFDPISQRNYYELFAIFNNQDEPTLKVPTPEQTATLEQLQSDLKVAETKLAEHDKQTKSGYQAWLERLQDDRNQTATWTVLEPSSYKTTNGSTLVPQDSKALFVDFSGPAKDTFVIAAAASLPKPTAIRLEALTHSSLPKNGPGRAGNGNFVLNEVEVFAVDANGKRRPLALADAFADHSQSGYPIIDAIDGDKHKTGWAINVKRGNPNVPREAVFLFGEPVQLADGERLEIQLHQNHGSRYVLGHFRLAITDNSVETLRIPASVRKILAKTESDRSDAERDQLLATYRNTDHERKPLVAQVDKLKRTLETAEKAIPTTMVLRERKTPRETFIHIRGDFLRHGDRVQPDVPEVLPPIKSEGVPNRLDFARWLVDPANPLTARVTVNRIWQRYFGWGLVDTENDFGRQGSKPSHPELLDWLSSEFVRQKWSMKSLHRLIVTSAVYRQSSQITDENWQRDPRNRQLARQSRMRLEAESIRDTALAVSGRLSSKMKGPSVHPPQPQGIYVLTQTKKPWKTETDGDRYRRGLYTYFWRSSPYPMLMTFDAADGITTCTRRVRSNTPLQSLTLANDIAFHELAQAFAVRILTEAPSYVEGRIRFAFRTALTREPTDTELATLTEFYKQELARFESDPAAAQFAAPADVPSETTETEAATWTAVARVLINLDEFITRE